MAEEKKPERKIIFTPSAIFAELIGIFILLYIVSKILASFNANISGAGSAGRFSSFQAFFNSFGLGGVFHGLVSTYDFLATLLSLLFILGIIYCTIRLRAIELEWKKSLSLEPVTRASEKPTNIRWERVVAHISSSNPSDWRLAILECDIILDELLDKEGYVGNTIGDKLKNANPGDFRTLNNAWEAHKIRNAIAHEGQDFTLTQREARRIVGLYETVFLEFNFIVEPAPELVFGTS